MNKLSRETRAQVLSLLCEGMSIRAVTRLTGVSKTTISKLVVDAGEAAAWYQDRVFQSLKCKRLQIDEVWGFIGMKRKTAIRQRATGEVGDVWTWVAIDPETKLVPTFAVGDRSGYMANCFIEDLSSRLSHRVQLSSDAFAAYGDAVERAFGTAVDYGSIIKTFSHSDLEEQRRYSPPDVLSVKRIPVSGDPVVDLISTSHVEKQNHTLRMHCRRLTRLTNAFSKKLENFKAAVALHYAYYNFVKSHIAIRCTPAMAAGVADTFWTVRDLVAMVEA